MTKTINQVSINHTIIQLPRLRQHKHTGDLQLTYQPASNGCPLQLFHLNLSVLLGFLVLQIFNIHSYTILLDYM